MMTATDFQKKGPDFGKAYEMLARRCEFPPSLEVFEHELAFRRRANPQLTVVGLARRLTDAYHRTTGFFGDDE